MAFSRMIRRPEDRDLYTMDQPEFEFGTNTGRQGTFNPEDAEQSQMAMSRLRELVSSYGDRLEPNYTGKTGVNDLGGYSQMLNARTEAQNIQRLMSGQDPMQIKFGGMLKGPLAGLKPMPQTHEDWKESNPAALKFLNRKGY